MLRALGRLLLLGVTCIGCGSSGTDDSDAAGGEVNGGGAGKDAGEGGAGKGSQKGGSAGKAQGGDSGEGASAGKNRGGSGGTVTGGSGNEGGEDENGGTENGGTGGTGNGGTANAGGTDDGGSGGEGGTPPACPAECDGPCLEDGTCVECTDDTHCGESLSRCDTAVNTCVECLPESDNCSDDQYCTAEQICIPGCKDDASCGSGICTEAHDCEHCVNDGECAEGRLCSTGACMDACENEGEACGEGRTCCGGRCVDTARDVGNCGACASADATRACGAAAVCGRDGCVPARVASVCANARVVVLHGKAELDFASGDRLGAALSTCTLPPEVRTVLHTDPVVANVTSGQPFGGIGDLLLVAGGPFVQNAAAYLEFNGSALVRSAHDAVGGNYEFRRVSDDAKLASVPVSSVGPTHDLVRIEFVRDRESGAPVLMVYGFHENGTAAAAWLFENEVLPALSEYDEAYYIYEWTDGGEPGPDGADAFEFLGSGG